MALFLYDSLIPSMLSSFGGSAPTVSFDFFINSGLSFSGASSHSLRSDIVLGSIFTGLYPHRSGIHKLYDDQVSLTGNGYFNEKTEDLTATFAFERY